MTVNYTVSDTACHDYLNDWGGPVGRLLVELSVRAANVARRVVHIKHEHPFNLHDDSFPVGYTLASIGTDYYTSGAGLIYGGISAEFYPSMYLEWPADQLHRTYPFLTTGVDSLIGTV